MTLYQVDVLPFTAREVELWAKQWWEEGEKYQSFLVMGLKEPLIPGDHIWVENCLFEDVFDSILNTEEHVPRYITLINEYLTKDTCNRLLVVLKHIRDAQGIGYRDAMAYLILSHTICMDIEGMCEGKKPILFSGRADQGNAVDVPLREDDDVDSSERDLDSAPRGAAIWSIRQLADYWNALGGLFAESLPTQRHKQCYYQIIPPVDLSIDELKSLYEAEEEQYEPLKVFLRTDPVYSKEAESFIETFRTAEELGCDVHVTISEVIKTNSSVNGIGDSNLPGEITGTQQDVPPDFLHSDNYTWICWRGQEFKPTVPQGKVVRFMHEQYQRGIRVLHEDSIMPASGIRSKRMHNLFRSRPGIIGTFIIHEPRGRMYRLNISA
jgi:hypothetical protein